MSDLPVEQEPELKTNNVVYIEFFDKTKFPPGDWMREPDFCQWSVYDLECLAIRDMKLGIWRGFVSAPQKHKAHSKSIEQLLQEEWFLNLEIHGGISMVGKLPIKYKDLNKGRWWIGFECTQGEDLLPLVKFDAGDPLFESIRSFQTYKDLLFVRRETNNLAKQLLRANR